MPDDPQDESRDPAESFADTLHRHDVDSSEWQEAEAVTGRPVDKAGPNSTLAERAKARAGEKRVNKDDDEVENKAVQSAPSKNAAAPAKKAAKKS
jgi:hypothetical protein